MLTSEHPEPHSVLSETSTRPARVLTHEDLSGEDKMILRAALQDVANELRRIKHGRLQQQKEKL